MKKLTWTAIELVGLPDVARAQVTPLTDLRTLGHAVFAARQDSVQGGVPGEGVLGVVHNTVDEREHEAES